MASISETGHAINIANFKILIGRCEEFGAAYNPPNSDISIAQMTAKLNSVETLQAEYIVALIATKLPINEREVLFGELSKVVVRSYNLFRATKASMPSMKDAKGYMMKITGQNSRIPKLEHSVAPIAKHVSTSQQSYAQKVENFDRLVNFYKADGCYTPNETALQIGTLEGLLDNLRMANENVYEVVANAMTKRTARDHGLYDMGEGLVDLSLSCKKYVKGLYGGKSAEAMGVIGIKFRRFMVLNPV